MGVYFAHGDENEIALSTRMDILKRYPIVLTDCNVYGKVRKK